MPKTAILNSTVSVASLFVGIFFVVFGYQMLKFLPEKYYFSFSSAISGQQTSAFFVKPPGISAEKRCAVLREFNLIQESLLTSEDAGQLVYECAQQFNMQLGSVDMEAGYWSIRDSLQSSISDDEQLQLISKASKAYQVEGTFDFLIAFVLRLMPAAICGIGLAYIFGSHALVAAPLACAAASFIFIWPTVIFWDLVVDHNWKTERPIFFLMYASYIALYFYTGRLFASLALRFRLSKHAQNVQVNTSDLTTGLVQQLITAAVAGGITLLIR